MSLVDNDPVHVETSAAVSERVLIVEDDDSPDGEWQVSWKVEEYAVS